jgi:hypothetical protein
MSTLEEELLKGFTKTKKIDKLKRLVQDGANVNYKNKDGWASFLCTSRVRMI